MFRYASSGVSMPTPPAPQPQQARQLMGVTTGDPPTIGSPDNVSIASTSQVGPFVLPRPCPSSSTVILPVLCIRIGFKCGYGSGSSFFFRNADADPGSQTNQDPLPPPLRRAPSSSPGLALLYLFLGFRIRVHLIRIRIQHFWLNTDPDPKTI
jgi:hypothetical protein